MKPETKRALTDVGLLILRVGLGGMFVVFHGWPKISGGTEKWTELGKAMGSVGITFWPVFWGFMAAFAEFVGGIAIVLGLAFRPMCALLTITMAVAATMHLSTGKGSFSYPVEIGIVALALIFTGPGRLNLGRFFKFKKHDF